MKTLLKALNSRNTKISVLMFLAGFIFFTGLMWIGVALGLLSVQLPIPSTILVGGLVVLFIAGAFIWLAVEVTKTVFDGQKISWGGVLMIPVTWLWALVSAGIMVALYIAGVQALGSVW